MTLPHSHEGPWTMRVPQCTRDELHMDVVVLAQMYGFVLAFDELGRQERYRSTLGDSPVIGTGRLADPAAVGDLHHMAFRAVEWLNEHAPSGCQFWLTDGLYLLPVARGREAASVEAWPTTWTGRRSG